MKFFFILIFLLPVIIIFGNKDLLGQYQYKINENFEGTVFPPPGWSVKNVVAGTGEWKSSNRMTNMGNGCAVSNFTLTGSNNYLVSKRFIPELGDSLILYFKQTFWVNYKDTFNVFITNVDSLFNGNKTKLLNLIDNVNYPNPSFYGRKAISLNAFAGQTVWLGFQHVNLDGDNIRLDDISVRQKDFPVISYTALSSINNVSNRNLSGVTITDYNGIDSSSNMKPRIYYKKSRDANTLSGWKFTKSNNNSSPFEFTIDYSLLNGLAYGDTIQYFIVAQDMESSVSISSGTFASQPANVSLTSSAFPIGGAINSYKINDVPSISYTALANTNDISNRTLSNVVITDSDGIQTASGLRPRIYFKKSGDVNIADSWKFSESNNNSSPFEFTIDYTLLNGLSYGDSIQYFIVAQDVENSVSISSGTFASQPANVSLTSAAFPIGGAIDFYKINDVPVISYTALANTNDISNRTLSNVMITDSDGIQTASGLRPRIYFKKSGDVNIADSWKFSESNNNSSPFEFTIDYSLLQGINYRDTIQYFIVAQDMESSVSISSGTFASQPSNVSLTSAAFPIGGVVNSYEILGIDDIGIESNMYPAGIISSCEVDKFVPKACIKNFSTSSQTIPFDITYSITGSVNFMSVRSDTLYAGHSKIICFDTAMISDTGSYQIKVYTSLSSDQNRLNDTLSSSFAITNSNYGGGLSDNGGYYFSNSVYCSSRSASQPEFCWKDTSGSKNLILSGQNVSEFQLCGNIDNGYFSLGNIIPSGSSIKFYDRYYDSVFISTNGLVAFTKRNLYLTGMPEDIINTDTSQFSFFAALLTDIDFGNNLVSGSRLSYKVAGNHLIITYDKAPLKSGSQSDYVSFQLSVEFGNDLAENSNLLVQFNEQSSGNSFITRYNENTLPSHLVGMKNNNGKSLLYRLKDSLGISMSGPVFSSSLALQLGPSLNKLYNKCSQVQVSALLEAIYPHRDTITLSLRDTKYPYPILESKKIFLDEAGKGITSLTIPSESYSYYLSVNHRNSIETWSKSGGSEFKSFNLNYDFSTDSTQAFGNNMKMSDGKAYIYTGDVNEDNTIDGNDLLIIFNDISNYSTGYILTDLNNDGIVDLGDIILGFNNNTRFVSLASPQ